MRIISYFVPNRRSVFVELMSFVGSAYDPRDKQGLFHCFEHMAFKGTKNRNVEEIRTFAARNLLNYNAITRELVTTYEAKVIDRKLPQACDFLTDIYFNSTFPKKDLEVEKKPIFLEIARRNDDDHAIAYFALMRCLFSKDNPQCFDGAGTVEGIKNVTHADMLAQKKKWHVPSNTVALAIGNVRHKNFVKEISKRVPLDYTRVDKKQWLPENDLTPAGRGITIKRPARGKVILMLGCKITRYQDDLKTEEAVSMLSRFIGGSNSRLWHEVREKRGLAYAIGSSYSGAPGLGDHVRIYAEVEHKEIGKVYKIINKVLKEPIRDKVRFEEMRQATIDSVEVAVEENGLSYETRVRSRLIENKPVKGALTYDERRLKVIKSLKIRDLENARKKFFKLERFAKVVLIRE